MGREAVVTNNRRPPLKPLAPQCALTSRRASALTWMRMSGTATTSRKSPRVISPIASMSVRPPPLACIPNQTYVEGDAWGDRHS